MKLQPTKKIRALTFVLSTCLIQCLLFAASAFAATESDNFDDNTRNTTKWGHDYNYGHAVLTEKNHRLEYSCSSGTTYDSADRPWNLTQFPYSADWSIQMDLFNGTSPTEAFQNCTMGINLVGYTHGNGLYTEMYSSAMSGVPARSGFQATVTTNGSFFTSVDTGNLSVSHGAVRIEFDSTSKVITLLCDTNVADGYQWSAYGSFGIDGAGGTDGNSDWEMVETNYFYVFVYGYSTGMTITEGQMFVDNFVETGGILSHGHSVPTGNFQFGFPTNNPALTPIVSLTGNYTGISPTRFNRNYSFDVAEDESGKLAVMGVADGILDKNGSPDISGVIGSIKTVNGQPKAQLKSSFVGTRDGLSVSASGSASGPVELIDVGATASRVTRAGGVSFTPGVGGTGTYKSKIAGVPFGGKNLPIQVAAPSGSENNLKKEWSLQLDVSKRDIKGKEKTIASAQLLLPNGETIVFPEKIVKFSPKAGYSLSFTRGTNTTVVPAKIDKKTSIAIKKLTLIDEGDVWKPSGGVITYKFLGQKGTTNLLEFVPAELD